MTALFRLWDDRQNLPEIAANWDYTGREGWCTSRPDQD
jgi:hypothetical protein